MKWVACDLCGSFDAAVLLTAQDPRGPNGGQSFRAVECRDCGLIYVSPRPEGPELAPFYPPDYYEDLEPVRGRPERRPSSWRTLRKSVRRSLLERFYGYPATAGGPGTGTNGPPWFIQWVLLQMGRWSLQVRGREAAIIPFVGEGRLLDVGCGTGKGLEPFRETGWNVTAVEVSPFASSIARARLACDILVGDFVDIPLEDESFDVVRFSHNLEHLPSPRWALAKAWRILRPDGLLWIEVPNAASLDRWLFGRHWFCWDLPRHLYHFTPLTLVRLLECTGFRPVKVTCDGSVHFFTESVRNILAHRLGIRPRRTKVIATLARPLVYALGAMNRGAILTVHAEKDSTRGSVSPGRPERMRAAGLTRSAPWI